MLSTTQGKRVTRRVEIIRRVRVVSHFAKRIRPRCSASEALHGSQLIVSRIEIRDGPGRLKQLSDAPTRSV